MGAEARCEIELSEGRAHVHALLETDELIIRGAMKLRLPLASLQKIKATAEALEFECEKGAVRLLLGAQSARWAKKIQSPPTLFDKLGVKAGQTVALIGPAAIELALPLEKLGASVVRSGECDVAFLSLRRAADLDRIAALRDRLRSKGALWLLRPKGSSTVGESTVRSAARGAGLVDVKTCRFSDALTADKYVVKKP